jgi:hypothetical protein
MNFKIFWKNISPWLDRDYYLFTTATILVTIAIFHHFLTKDKFENDQAITRIKGNFIDYSFVHAQGARGTTRTYYFWLDNYDCTFQIPADYLSFFKRESFKRDIKIGDTLELIISTNRINDLQSDKEVRVLGIKNRKTTYLDENKSIKMERSNAEIYVGLGFLIAGLIYYIIRRRYWTPRHLKTEKRTGANTVFI